MSDKVLKAFNDWRGVIAIIITAAAFYGFQMRRIDEIEKDLYETQTRVNEIESILYRIDNTLTEISTDNKHILKAIDELKDK